jgi:hypothetical protein
VPEISLARTAEDLRLPPRGMQDSDHSHAETAREGTGMVPSLAGDDVLRRGPGKIYFRPQTAMIASASTTS